MGVWAATKARVVRAALRHIGWQVKRQRGSHVTLSRDGWNDYVWAFHDDAEVGPAMLSRVSRMTGLQPDDL